MALFDSIRLGSSAAEDYEVEKSLRINKPDNPQLYRTGSNNADTFTVSMWIKIGRLYSSYRVLFASYADGLTLNNDHRLRFSDEGDGSFYSTAKFRDPTAWYHIVMAVNTSGTTVYVNNVTHITSSSKFNLSTASGAIRHFWQAGDPAEFAFDGYGAEVALIDGQALTPSSFAETDALTGQWIPKDLSSLTFGSNGHWLRFTDSTNIGKDFSGNSNDFTTANYSTSAGVGNDLLDDTPTNNFCTLNSIHHRAISTTFSNGNLQAVLPVASTTGRANGNFVVYSGKWYWEVKYTGSTGDYLYVGVAGADAHSYQRAVRGADGELLPNTSTVSVSFTTNDVIMVALDVDNGKWYIGKNGSWMLSGDPVNGTGFVHSGLVTTYNGLTAYFQNATGSGSQTININFGQRAFSYTPPTGFKKLNSANLPDPTIKLPNKHFGTILYTGNDADNRNVTDSSAIDFTPDWVWHKTRNATNYNFLFDSVRGATKILVSNTGDAEATQADSLSAFITNGFTVSDNTANADMNSSSHTYVAWNWKGGGTASSNSDGSLTSSVSANTTAGFSIGTYTGQSSGSATVGHGLGVAPDVVITKSRTSASNWYIYHKSIGQDGWIILDSTGAATTGNSAVWNPAPTSSVFTYGSGLVNQGDIVFYAFSEVAGYSKFGSYTGNGSSDGTFVFTGFRPAVIIVKRSSATQNWLIFDNKRGAYNPDSPLLYPNLSNAEDANTMVDFVSNGFKWRAGNLGGNDSGDTFIYLAFAESPFKYSRAR